MAKQCLKCDPGLPPWLATFADLMSLLMCFFVLLLSFSEIDAIRFKKMAESMKDAFGVQREVPATDVVMGTSVVKQEFSPSAVQQPTPEKEVRQTTAEEKEQLEVSKEVIDAVAQKIAEDIKRQTAELQEALQKEIEEGLISIETEEAKIIVRIQEKGSFPSGSAELNPGFMDVVDRISDEVAKFPGRVVVAGHTDDVPIATSRFRSNWDLSAARAVTVVHALLRNSLIDPKQVLVEGYADSHPIVPNDSVEQRAQNRRVELVLIHGADREGEPQKIGTGPAKEGAQP